MKKIDLLETFKEFYFHEIQVKHQILFRLQLLFALIATAATVMAYMTKSLDKSVSETLDCGIYFLLVLTAVALLVSFIYMVKAFLTGDYREMATPAEIENHRQELVEYENEAIEYNSTQPDANRKTVSAEQDMQEYLYDKYADCTTHNINTNQTRALSAWRAFRVLLVGVIPLSLASIIFIVFDMDGSSPRKEVLIRHNAPIQIEMVYPKKNNMRTNDMSNFKKETPSKNKPQITVVSPPTKPKGPAERIVISNTRNTPVTAENNDDKK
ncbi:MAG: hypothetical protein ACKVJE_20290 [Pseudomonadales bacterium]